MFDNLKEFLSVVQESSHNLRQKLSEVQKARIPFQNKYVVKTVPEPLTAGAELLSHYQSTWSELHAAAEESSSNAERLDGTITEIHKKATANLNAVNDLYQALQSVPKLSETVDQITSQLQQLGEQLLTVERDLGRLEDLGERGEMERRKMDQHYNFSQFKEKKHVELKAMRARLAAENAARQEQQERRRMEHTAAASAAAFDRDLDYYKQTRELPDPTNVNIPSGLDLEQVELDIDTDDLDAFLES